MKSIVAKNKKEGFFSCGKKFGDDKIIAIRETYRSSLQETENEKEAIKHTANSVKCDEKTVKKYILLEGMQLYPVRGRPIVGGSMPAMNILKDFIVLLIHENNSLTPQEIQPLIMEGFQANISVSTIRRWITKLGYKRKRCVIIAHYRKSRRIQLKRLNWRLFVRGIDASLFMFLDESHICNKDIRTWSPKT